MKAIFIFFGCLGCCIMSFCQSKDSVYNDHGVSFHFPKDPTWEIGVIELKGEKSSDTYYIKDLDCTKITLFPENGDIPACITIIKNEYELKSSFDQYIQSIISEPGYSTVLDTSVFYRHGLKVFEIVWRWQELGVKSYSFQRQWHILDKNNFLSRISFGGVESSYFKHFKAAMRIMKSVELE